jgi:hypothetical protein
LRDSKLVFPVHLNSKNSPATESSKNGVADSGISPELQKNRRQGMIKIQPK